MTLCVVFRERPTQFGAARERGCSLNNFYGGLKAVVRPVPIPNTAVKRSVANGSSPIGSARVGRRQSFIKKPEKISSPAFLFSNWIQEGWFTCSAAQ